MKFKNILNTTRRFLYGNTPEILTGIGITGMITSTILAVRATPRALELLDIKKKEVDDDVLTIQETIKTAWKPYIPATVSMIISTTCLISAVAVNNRRNTALVTAYTLSEKAFTSYRNQVIEDVGKNKEKRIKDKVSQKQVDNNPPNKNQIILTNKGNTLLQDTISGRYFRSDLDSVRKAMNELNKELLHNDSISINDYYSLIGLTGIKGGDDIGWTVSKGLVEFDFSACIVNDDEPCIVIDYNIVPFTGFNKYA